jgi:predicted ABC-type ATPase
VGESVFPETATLDPDAVAVNLQAESEELSELEAGKRVLRSAHEYLGKGVSFSVETTLSGNTYLRMLAEARALGYRTCLFYIRTNGLTINIASLGIARGRPSGILRARTAMGGISPEYSGMT